MKHFNARQKRSTAKGFSVLHLRNASIQERSDAMLEMVFSILSDKI